MKRTNFKMAPDVDHVVPHFSHTYWPLDWSPLCKITQQNIIIIIMYTYNALINALSTYDLHMSLMKTIFSQYMHSLDSPNTTFYI